MTHVAIHVPAASSAAVPLEVHRARLSASWTKLGRFNAASGSLEMSATCEEIAQGFASGQFDPPPLVQRIWNPRTERYLN